MKWAQFRDGVLRTLDLEGIENFDAIIGHEAITLEVLSRVQSRYGSQAWYDCVETPNLLERVGAGYRNQPRKEIDAMQEAIDGWIESVDRVLTVSPSLKKKIETSFSPPVHLLRNFRSATPIPSWFEVERGAQLRKQTLVANPSGIATEFAPQPLIDALEILPPKFEYIWFGVHPDAENLRNLFDRTSVTSRCHLAGHIHYQAYPQYLALCDIGLIWLPPLVENFRLAFPNRVGDFIAAGIPIVTSRNTDIAEFVSMNGIGVVMETEDAAGIGSALEYAAADLAAFGEPLARAAKRFTWERETAQLGTLIANYKHVVIVVAKLATHQNRMRKLAKAFAESGIQVSYITSRWVCFPEKNIRVVVVK